MSHLDYEPHELMVCRIASEMRQDGDFVTILGSFTPLAYASYMLAKLTHAPDAWLVGYNAIGMPPVQLSFTGTEGAAYRGSYARSAFTPNGHLVHLGTHGLLECVSSAQIDGDGAINLTSIGDPDAPKVRLPGGAGSPEVLQNYRKVVAYFSKHDRRTLVERVDFATGRRAPISAGARAARGLVTEGPVTIVTPLAVLTKSEDDGRSRSPRSIPGSASTRWSQQHRLRPRRARRRGVHHDADRGAAGAAARAHRPARHGALRLPGRRGAAGVPAGDPRRGVVARGRAGLRRGPRRWRTASPNANAPGRGADGREQRVGSIPGLDVPALDRAMDG